MGKETGIAWTDHTFNPVWGCTKIGLGCDFCYADVWSRRTGHDIWGTGTFREFGDKHWRQPLNWNAAAQKAGVRKRVFCASMADIFDNQWPEHIRPKLWQLIRDTPWLDWQLVTKRIGNAKKMLPYDWMSTGRPYPNVWLVPTIVNQEEADRDLEKLFEIPAAIYGVSYEPALSGIWWGSALDRLHWIIGGGESNQRGMRECRIEWLEDTARQCAERGVAYFNKQIGAMPTHHGAPYPLPKGSKGDNPAEWPESIRIREFPNAA